MSNYMRTDRRIRQDQVTIKRFVEAQVGADPVAWLKAQAKERMILLAHADDGIIWGQVVQGAITTPSRDLIDQAALRSITLQAARLFDRQQEIYLWRTGEGAWRARIVVDGSGKEKEHLDEAQILWGTAVEETEIIDETNTIGFSRVTEGVQGMRHAVPLLLAEDNWEANRLRLGIRHYLESDDGWLRTAMSRLTGLWYEEEIA